MYHMLTDEHRMLRDVARSFASKEVEPLAVTIDHDERTPTKLVERVAEVGLFGLCIPEEYGGSAAGLTAACLVLEEIAKASPAFAGMLAVQMLLCPITVEIMGTAEQKRRILPRSATGERLLAYSQTEPAGAVNVMAHQTKLTRDGDAWRLNGAKLFCTQGEAKTYLVMCRTEVEGQQGYGAVIVEREAEGFSVAPYEDKLGWRGTNTGSLSFDNIRITRDNILGNPLTSAMLDHPQSNFANFLGHSASSLGAAQGLFDKTLEYVRDRNLYGHPMTRLSPISSWLAEIHAKIEAMRSLLYTAASIYDRGDISEYPLYGQICKTFICETAFDCTHRLLQMWGGSGMMNSTGVNRYMRDARVNLIAEGSTETHYSGMAEFLLNGKIAIGPALH